MVLQTIANRFQLTSNAWFYIAVIVCNFMETGLIKIMKKFTNYVIQNTLSKL